MGGSQELIALPLWIDMVFAFWIGDDKSVQLGEAGMQFVRKVFCTPKKVKPLLSHILREEDKLRIELTAQQFWYMRALGARKRAAVTGGAGTGKTLLAMHKAQELAAAGRKTLLVCYNSPLADHLKDVAGQDLKDYLHPMGFHELCAWRIQLVFKRTGIDLELEARQAFPGEDRFHVQLPYALALSKDYLPDYQYDAIIVDEGQDFGADYWMALEMLLTDEKEGCFYVFYDPNQALYQSADHIKEIMQGDYPFPLTSNCRNTVPIHTAAYRFYKGEQIEPPKIEGEAIQIICQDSILDQRKQIHGLISDLVGKQGIEPKEIVVLIAGRNLEKYASLLSSSSLPAGIKYSIKRHRLPNTILVESVGRFKGLEASIIILWDVDEFDLDEDREALYVAFSRAKSRFFIVGTAEGCRKVTEASF
jgi:superfamily I DNA and RNA helicase